MPQHEYQFQIDYYGKGFLRSPAVPKDLQLPRNHFDAPWLVCALALERAKKGDFSLMPALLQLHGNIDDTALDHMCSALLTLAGTTSCFSRIVEVVKSEPNVSKVFDFCGALAVRGELSYIPILLEKYLSNEGNPDAAPLTDYILDLVGIQLLPVDMDDYEDAVMLRYQQMLDEFGDEKVLISQGERYGVTRLARHILRDLQSPYFRVRWKAEFEAATGIDCSSWYRDETLQPLAAAAIIEEFLESPEAAKYEDGVRYFFGHRIPH